MIPNLPERRVSKKNECEGQRGSSKFRGDGNLTCLVLTSREYMLNRDETCTHFRVYCEREIAGGTVGNDWVVVELSCVKVNELCAVVFFLI